jgi:hypothetical protein
MAGDVRGHPAGSVSMQEFYRLPENLAGRADGDGG